MPGEEFSLRSAFLCEILYSLKNSVGVFRQIMIFFNKTLLVFAIAL